MSYEGYENVVLSQLSNVRNPEGMGKLTAVVVQLSVSKDKNSNIQSLTGQCYGRV